MERFTPSVVQSGWDRVTDGRETLVLPFFQKRFYSPSSAISDTTIQNGGFTRLKVSVRKRDDRYRPPRCRLINNKCPFAKCIGGWETPFWHRMFDVRSIALIRKSPDASHLHRPSQPGPIDIDGPRDSCRVSGTI